MQKIILRASIAAIVLTIDLVSADVTEKISVAHNEKCGKTTVVYPGLNSAQLYNIYRSDEPINAESIGFARRVATRIHFSKLGVEIESPESGEHYYAVFALNEAGREIRHFGDNVSSAIMEKDCTPPASPLLSSETSEGASSLVWQKAEDEAVSRYTLYGRDSGGDKWVPIRVLLNEQISRRGSEMRFTIATDDSLIKKELCLSASDSSGNESRQSNPVRFAVECDFAIATETSVSRNKDLSISRMYPLPNTAVDISFISHNRSSKHAENIPVVISVCKNDDPPKVIHELMMPTLAAFSSVKTGFTWKPETAGRWTVQIQIDPQGKIDKTSPKEREVRFEVLVPEKDLRFIWYGGNSEKLKYANVIHPVLPKDMSEWKRRGASPFALVGTGDTDKIKQICDKAVEDGYEGALFDEVGKTNKDFPALLELFPSLKKDHPNFFLGCWQIGEFNDQSIVSLKEGSFDHFLVEVYLQLGRTPLSVLENAILELQEKGISHHSVIGLGLDKALFKGKSSNEQIDFLTGQMTLIRKIAPEMPGVAFFSYDSADLAVVERVDELCAELFFEPKKQ